MPRRQRCPHAFANALEVDSAAVGQAKQIERNGGATSRHVVPYPTQIRSDSLRSGRMRTVTAIGDLPTVPAIYAMYGGEDRPYVAYVGIGDNLRRRVTQHLVNRNSSATTDTGAVRLHPDDVSAVAWWEHPGFADRDELAAAELVAFDVLEPTMRSRGGITAVAKQRATDEAFRDEMTALFVGAPTGRLELTTFAGVVRRLAALERRMERLENERP